MLAVEFIKYFFLMFIILGPELLILFISSVSGEYPARKLSSVVLKANLVGFVLLLVFALSGVFILKYIFNISIESLRITGGIILGFIGIEQLRQGKVLLLENSGRIAEMAVVPLGTPIIAGPAAITLTIAISYSHGVFYSSAVIVAAIIANILTGFIAIFIGRFIKKKILEIINRIMGLFVTSVGVEMMLTGIKSYFNL